MIDLGLAPPRLHPMWDTAGTSPTGLGHRFTNGLVKVDVLAEPALGRG